MFSDTLSTSLLHICDKEKITYAVAAERAGCSPEFFGRIIRRKLSPTISVFEKLCHAFCQTPNQLLGVCEAKEEEKAEDAVSYRTAMQVNEIRVNRASRAAFPICPRCASSLEREYQAYFDRCGQYLLWDGLHKAKRIIIPSSREFTKHSGEALIIPNKFR